MQRTLSSSHLKIPILLALLATYIILFYLIFTHQYRLDFSSLYSACQALCSHENPYRVLFTTYFPIVKKLPANLNPPFVLWLFTPFTKLNYDTAVIVWSILSFVLGLIGAGIAFNYAFSKDFLKKNKLYLYLIYLASFATIIDTAIAQLGALLLFLIMSGYHFYRQHNDYAAGILWGVAISIKLFPALLFFYALIQKRYRVCAGLAMVFLLSLLITFLIYGPPIYHHYFSMMRRVLWYGDSWNASIYGMIFRLFIDTSKAYNLAQIHLLYGALFAAFFIFYIKQLREIENKHLLHQSFCLTLVMMLLLSPFGWLYYFPILTLPLAITWSRARQAGFASATVWVLCLFFLNFPMDYIPANKMQSLLAILSFHSFHFYGLLLLLYLTKQTKTVTHATTEIITDFTPIFVIIFSFVLAVMMISFWMRLS